MAITRKNTFFTRALLPAALLVISSGATAGTVVNKPGVQEVIASEFGSAIARSANYTLVGASQETVVIPGEPIFGGSPVGAQGVVYLFNGTSATPERRYQFAGNDHFFKKAGVQVAMSNKWLAFAAMEDFSNGEKPSRVYIVGKVNNQWPQCPTVNDVLDCTTSVKVNGEAGNEPIVTIDYPSHVDPPSMTLAISDDYLVMGNQQTSELFIYRYDIAENRWVQEFAIDDLDDKYLGAAVAIEGDKVAVSAPHYNKQGQVGAPTEYGMVRIYQRNAAGEWSAVNSLYGYFTSGNFGRTLDMHAGNLVIGSGVNGGDHHLTFYRVDANGGFSAQNIHQLNAPHKYLALHGDTAIVATEDLDAIVAVYKRDTSTDTWSRTAALNGFLYLSPTNGLPYPASDPVDLVGDDMVLGWRAYSNNLGGFIHEKVSQIDACKSTRNLVANCSFDNASSAGWQFLNHMGASSWASYAGGQLKATIYYGGSVHWHIQARTAVDLSEGGTYALRFRARADSYRDVTVNIGHNGNQDNNWQSYGQTTFHPGPQWTEFSYEFYGVPEDANAFLDFNLGNAGTAAVTIDGVSLTPLDM